MHFENSLNILKNALHEKVGSTFAFYVEQKGEVNEFYLGNHSHPDSDAITRATTRDSIFDLASVSKIVSTVSLLFHAESEGKITFQDKVIKYFPKFASENTTILDLMCHRSGLPAHQEFFRRYEAGEAKMGDQQILLKWIYEAGLPHIGTQVYSDLGFMLLGFIIEQVYQKPIPEVFQEKIVKRLGLESSGYVVLPTAASPARMFSLLAPKERFVATETCPWRKKTMQGEIHDDNTWTMGGYAGHAGVFSTARETALLFKHLWKQSKACPEFINRKKESPGIFSYGYMTYPGLRPFPGPAFHDAIGHTGFVGTSAWYHEPSDTLAILLGNRVHPARADTRFIQLRLEFHQALWKDLGL